MANKTVVIIGIPAGVIGVNKSARIMAQADIKNSRLSLSRGQTSPQKAAGTAASKPHTDGSPIALAPSAPRNVNRFQKI